MWYNYHREKQRCTITTGPPLLTPEPSPAVCVQVLLQPDGNFPDVQMNKLPWLVYVSREKRPKHDHNKKAGAMNSLVRASGVITNAPYILNLDCDHYVNYAKAFKEVSRSDNLVF